MSALKWGITIFGVLLILAGITFALQGAYGLSGRSFMDNNPPWIYIGSVIAIIGGAMVVVANLRLPGRK